MITIVLSGIGTGQLVAAFTANTTGKIRFTIDLGTLSKSRVSKPKRAR